MQAHTRSRPFAQMYASAVTANICVVACTCHGVNCSSLTATQGDMLPYLHLGTSSMSISLVYPIWVKGAVHKPFQMLSLVCRHSSHSIPHLLACVGCTGSDGYVHLLNICTMPMAFLVAGCTRMACLRCTCHMNCLHTLLGIPTDPACASIFAIADNTFTLFE